jgi:rubredoxin
MLWVCSVCGYVHEGEEAPEVCPKCGAPKEAFERMSEDAAKKIYDSDRTNDIHMEIVKLAMKIKDLAKEGVELNLDPGCVSVFQKAHDEAWIIKQRSKAEIETHVGKGKW